MRQLNKTPGGTLADAIALHKVGDTITLQPLADAIALQLKPFDEQFTDLGRRVAQMLEPHRLTMQTLAAQLEEHITLPTAELGHALAALAPPPLPAAVTEQLTGNLNGLFDLQRHALPDDTLRLIQQTINRPLVSEAFKDLGEALRAAIPSFPSLDIAGIDARLSPRATEAIERFQARAAAIASAPAATAEDVETLVSDAEAVTAAVPTEARDSIKKWMADGFRWLLGISFEDPAKEAMGHALAFILLVMGVVSGSPALPPAPAAPTLLLPAPSPTDAGALTIPGGWQIEGLPAVIRRAGPKAERVTVEFFTAQIRNRNTRQAYAHAAMRFFNWCEDRNLELADITPFAVAAYVEELQREASAPTVKQHLAAIRMLFDALVVGQVLPMNPAASVRGPRHVVKRGKTPVLAAEEARTLLDAIDTGTIAGLRDRALIGVMVYSFARVGAAVGMRVEDYYPAGKRWWLRLHEKGGKRHDVPAHHNVEAYLDAYLDKAGIREEKRSPLFRTLGRGRQLTSSPMHRVDVLRMVKRRAIAAGLPASTCCHTFRATGITAYLENGGTIEKAQQIAAHESPRTTKLYDRTSDELTLDEIERIVI